MAPQQAIHKITNDVYEIIKNNQFPFIFGGSKEGTYGSNLAFQQLYSNSHHILIAGKPTLKRPYDNNKLTSDNLMTLLTNHPTSQQSHFLTVFGASQRYFPSSFNHKFDLISYEDIRGSNYPASLLVNTQAGFVFNQLITKLKGEKIHLSLSVEAIERFRGCRDVLALGLTVEEIIEIFLIAGMSKGVLLVDIT